MQNLFHQKNHKSKHMITKEQLSIIKRNLHDQVDLLTTNDFDSYFKLHDEFLSVMLKMYNAASDLKDSISLGTCIETLNEAMSHIVQTEEKNGDTAFISDPKYIQNNCFNLSMISNFIAKSLS